MVCPYCKKRYDGDVEVKRLRDAAAALRESQAAGSVRDSKREKVHVIIYHLLFFASIATVIAIIFGMLHVNWFVIIIVGSMTAFFGSVCWLFWTDGGRHDH